MNEDVPGLGNMLRGEQLQLYGEREIHFMRLTQTALSKSFTVGSYWTLIDDHPDTMQ